MLEVKQRDPKQGMLPNNEACMRWLVEGTTEYALFMLDAHGNVLSWSPGAERILGYQIEEILGQHFSRFYSEEDVHQGKPGKDLKEAAQEDQCEEEGWLVRKDGARFWANVILTSLRDEAGNLLAFSSFSRDFTQRKLAEEEFRAAERRFRPSQQTNDDAIVSADAAGKIIFWNKSAQKTFGYAKQEVLGRPLTLLIPERHHEAHQRELARLQSSGQANAIGKTIQLQGLKRDGSEFPLELSLAIWDRNDEKCYSVLIRDISERTWAEELLRQSEERFRLLFTGLEDYAIYMLDAEGYVLSWNAGAEHIYGYRTDEIVGRHFSIFYPKETVDRGWPGQELAKATTEGRCEDEDWRVRKDGSLFWANVVISVLKDEAGQLSGFAKVTRDLTERKLAQEKLEMFSRQLQRSNEELDQFASVTSHDLQEPLRKIQAFGDRLQAKFGETLGAQGREYLDRMLTSATRMRTLINDLLAFSRLTAKVQPFAPVDLGQLAREAVSDLEDRVQETDGRVKVGELPTVDADAMQMRQLFQNLIGNALKFHRAGTPPIVNVEGRILSEMDRPFIGDGQAEPLCEITVQDNGIGFEEIYLDRIFAIFQRLHGRDEYEGSGMGLAICRKIVERHGGCITGRSAPGQGATFVVTIPARHPEKKDHHETALQADYNPDGR